MKIVFVLAGLSAGGAERVITLISGHLASVGHTVTVIAFDSVGDLVFHRFDQRVQLVRLSVPSAGRSFFGSPIWALRRVVRLRRALREIRPAVVVSFLLKVNVLTLLATRGLDCRVVVSERNHPVRGTGSRFWRVGRSWLYPLADAVVLQTEGSRKLLSRRICKRSVVIPNPISLFPRGAQSSADHTLVAVGRLESQKGFDLLLTAFARIEAQYPDWRLIVWGEGPMRRALELQRQALRLEGRVSFPGTTAKPGGWTETATAFVLSSRYEGFGNVVGEAMAAGLPIVAFNCEFGVGEMLEHGRDGLLVPPEDVAALARSLDRLLGDEGLRATLGATAKHSADRLMPMRIFSAWDELLATVVPQPD